MTNNNTLEDLGQFTGTEYWYRHPLFPRQSYTDGVRYVAQNAGAYWLIEKIFALQRHEAIRAEAFQVWKLKVNADATAILSVEDGNENHVYAEPLTFTDFPVQGITFWLTDDVLFLPSEY